MALLTCTDLALGYDGQEILRGLNFSVAQGDYLCIVGENGSGKSTLMKTLLGLMAPVSGEILTGDGLMPNQIGYLPQQTAVQRDFPASVQEIILSGCLSRCGLRPFYSGQDKASAKAAMEKLHIAHLSRRCYRELSGGQQQRVLLARALCATQALLLLDEPVTGLDPAAAADFYRMVNELNHTDKITIIMVSHDIRAALANASHILHIGDTVFFGTVQEYLGSRVGQIFTQQGGMQDESH